MRQRIASRIPVGIVAALLIGPTAPWATGTALATDAASLSAAGVAAPASLAPGAAYAMGVLVLKYFPLTADGQDIDIGVTGDVGDPLATIRSRVDAITANLVAELARGSTHRGYADAAAQPSLRYSIVDTKEFHAAVPSLSSTLNPSYPRRADYGTILRDVPICDYVDHQGVDEVWIWAYQGPHQLDISESKMSGPYGDVSNSYRLNDMPRCSRTYVVYTYNYGRGTAEAIEDHGHQIEAELSDIDAHLFRDLFEGRNYPATLGVTGRCGSVHNPPNARFEYDRFDPAPNPSDCLEWKPDGLGALSQIGCATWGCEDRGDTDNPALNYMIWWMQNLPGRANSIQYQGHQLRNWWDVVGNWDAVMAAGPSLTAPPPDTTPPSVTVLAARFAAGWTMTSASLPVTVAWSGTDAGSGIARYEVEGRTDGGAYAPIILSSSLARSVTQTLTVGHRYQFRVRATDGAASVSRWAVGPILAPAVLQESSTAIRYSGRWTTESSGSASGGRLRWSSQGGATVTMTFSGRSIAWVAPRGPSRGSARVYLDGAYAGTVSLFSAVSQPPKIVFSKSWSQPAAHVLRLVVMGTAGHPRVDLDAFLVLR